MPKKLITYTDGGSRGNPGPSALGVYITDTDGNAIKRHGRYLDVQTNNFAEYSAIVDALTHCKELGADEVEMRMDSELAVKQLKGEYRVKNPGIGALFLQVHNLRLGFKKVTFTHVRREYNKEADAIVNEVLDRHVGKRNHR